MLDIVNEASHDGLRIIVQAAQSRLSGSQAHPFVQDLDLSALLLQRREHVHARVIADAVDWPLLQLLVVATVGPRV